MKPKSKAYLSILSAILLVALSVSFGCKGKESQPKEIPIGVILPLTGSGGVWGQNAKEGIDLAVDEINADGGVNGKKIVALYEDSQTLPKFAVTALNKHINTHDVQACIVDMVSSNVLAMAPIANREKVVLISPGASSPKITIEGGEFVFRNWPSDALQGELNAKYAKEVMRASSVSILYINNEYGAGLKSVFESEFERLGGTVTAVESFEQGSSDFRSVLAKLNSKKSELVYILAYPKEWPIILSQAKELGVESKILGTESAEDPSIIKNAGSAADGLVFSVPVKPSAADERVSHFLNAFQSRYSKEPGITADAAYDAVYLVVDAIKKDGYDSTKIKDFLLAVKNYRGASGVTSFDENGDCIKPFTFKRIEEGQVETVE